MMGLRPLITICGTTGVGKSKLAIELALALSQGNEVRGHGYQGARIINADAMQVYAGMDVITNKVPVAEQCGVEHLLMSFKQPGEQYIVTQWVRDALRAIEDTHERNQIPIVVGGTSYWIQHLIFSNRLVSLDQHSTATRQSSSVAPVSDELAKSLASLPPELLDLFNALPEQGPSATTEPELSLSLHALLSVLDPQVAQRWHWRDTRKVLRNLTIIRDTGRRSSEILAEQAQITPLPRCRTLCFWLYAKPDMLKPRLDARVDQMVEQGLLNEIRALREIVSASAETTHSSAESDGEGSDMESDDPSTDYTLGIYQSIGYKEFHDYLGSPIHSEVEFQRALESMKSATRKYAKRQIMWIRNKLLPAVDAANSISRSESSSDVIPTYLLDATELSSSWDSNVRQTAERIVEDFLEGRELPDPLTLSDTARDVLSNAGRRNDSSTSLNVPRKTICQTCTVNNDRPVMIAEGKEWDVHVRTRTHRRLLKKAHKRNVHDGSTRREKKDEESDGTQSDSLDTTTLFST